MNNSYSIDELKNIKNNIDKLHENEQIEIIKLLKKNEFKYTINNNGVFINMNLLTDSIIKEILDLLDFSKVNKKKLDETIQIINQYKNSEN